MRKILFLFTVVLLTSGCLSLSRDQMTDIRIITGPYPIQYIVNYLYGDHAEVVSIYPIGTLYSEYQLNNNQINDFASADLFVFAGQLETERDYARAMLGINRHLRLIDASSKITATDEISVLWLNPANAIMMAQNIKNGLAQYISNPYLIREVEANFTSFQQTLTEIDAELTIMANNSQNRTLVFMDDSFMFLERYGFNVISLADNDNLTTRTINQVISLINQERVTRIFVPVGAEINAPLTRIREQTSIRIERINTIKSITEEQVSDNETYISILRNNLEILKRELYR